MTYSNTHLFINGTWHPASQERSIPVTNPATGEQIGTVSAASQQDLDHALESTQKGFARWRNSGTMERSEVLRHVAAELRALLQS